MCKKDLVKKMAEVTGFTYKKAEVALNGVLDTISDVLVTEGEVKLIGFGTFTKRRRAARVGCNPKTRERIEIPETNTVTFKAGKIFKDTVNGKRDSNG